MGVVYEEEVSYISSRIRELRRVRRLTVQELAYDGATSNGTGTCIPLRHGKIQFEPYRSGTYEPYGQNDVYHL